MAALDYLPFDDRDKAHDTGISNFVEQFAKILRIQAFQEQRAKAFFKEKIARSIPENERTSVVNTIDQIAKLLRNQANLSLRYKKKHVSAATKKKQIRAPLKHRSKRPISRRRTKSKTSK